MTRWIDRACRWIGMICLTGLLWLSMAAFAPTASARILRTADLSDAIVVQSRRTLYDRHHQSWQLVAFKRVKPDVAADSLRLRLVGFPGHIQIAHPQPIAFVGLQEQTWAAADRSEQILVTDLPPNVGQYDLQAVLAQLPTDQRLRLEVRTVDRDIITLQIPPPIIQEWQTIANTTVNQLMNGCEQFPLEARQNPHFPQWTGCRIEQE